MRDAAQTVPKLFIYLRPVLHVMQHPLLYARCSQNIVESYWDGIKASFAYEECIAGESHQHSLEGIIILQPVIASLHQAFIPDLAVATSSPLFRGDLRKVAMIRYLTW